MELGIRSRWSRSLRHHIVLKCNYATVEGKSIKKQQSKAIKVPLEVQDFLWVRKTCELIRKLEDHCKLVSEFATLATLSTLNVVGQVPNDTRGM